MAGLTLTEFLLARIAEDEAEFTVYRDQWLRNEGSVTRSGTRGWERQLAECEAKRRIVEYAELDGQRHLVDPHPHDTAESVAAKWHWREGVHDALLDTAKRLALPYADHPDYDESWRP